MAELTMCRRMQAGNVSGSRQKGVCRYRERMVVVVVVKWKNNIGKEGTIHS